ncbi:hypothetical protein MAGR_40010 [Mycolicibacterium agri]|uniref:Nucleoside phosphorylase domain-containing protein n=2 Tax=Mycolicibacterium agri TaxID=36811 RepID=A0A7I9W4R5_MYCAG|nr:hypothetical protein [Mycolicibacterium agri]GFG52560.1 hypothetical protein MAGR_40010 [Mycolicibacterium agri]
MPAPQFEDPRRRIIEFGATEADRGPRQPPAPAPMIALGLPFPAGEAPQPQPLQDEPTTTDPLPRADVLVVTWTVAEHDALADVLTPGFGRNSWYRYAKDFPTYLPGIRKGAPARNAQRLGSYFPTQIAGRDLLCVKSELHLNQDGVRTGDGTATLPVKRFFRQMIDEVKPSLVITVGTAGATFPPTGTVKISGMTCPAHELGDVMITRAAKFRLSQEFRNEPFAHTEYRCTTFDIPTARLATAADLLAVHAAKLVEPTFGVPTRKYKPPKLVNGFTNDPDFRIDGRDFPEFHPMLTTDSFEFGTSTNGMHKLGCGVEMGDAVLGMVVEEMRDEGLDTPDWLVIRNASDPQINGELPAGDNPAVPPQMRRALNMQAHWAVWYYEAYGYWTSVNSAIATWAMTA